jgi:hypothetical protein
MSMHRVPFVLAFLLFVGCAEKPPAHGCSSDGQCPVGARCSGGVCTGDTRPTASIADVGTIEEFALVRLDGSASSDPENDVFEHRWSIRSIDAPCAPPEVASRDAVAQVRFGCAGRYEVSLVVADSLGMPSDPARVNVTVQPSRATPLVVAGADIGTDHRCTGTPLRCRPTTKVQLTASAAAGVTLHWTVQPPAERPLDLNRRVVFSPSDSVASPVVDIVTDGTAISGDWIFRAEAVDRYGVIGAAPLRVSIRNRPPVVTFTPAGPFDHVFDAQQSTFRSEGAVAFSVVDPDGDPVDEVSGLWRHVGDGDESVFDGDFDGTNVWFTVAVPYAGREDAGKLREGEGLLRQIELYAIDSNRTVGTAEIPIVIGNRPPIPAGGSVDASVPHRFDAARSVYVAYARVGSFLDPDGDPIVDSSAPNLCGVLHVKGNDVIAECAVPFTGTPAVDQLVGTRTFPVAARDPWDATAVIPYRTVTIQNSAPVFAPTTSPATKCVADELTFRLDGVLHEYWESPIGFGVDPHATDPDGDPILVQPKTADGGTVTPASVVCTSAQCASFAFYEPLDWHNSGDVAFQLTDHSTLSATDGAARIEAVVSPTWQLVTVWGDANIGRACPALAP